MNIVAVCTCRCLLFLLGVSEVIDLNEDEEDVLLQRRYLICLIVTNLFIHSF